MERNEFVEKLKNEHKEIIELLDGSKKGNAFFDTIWRENLMTANRKINEHLKKEDEILYKELNNADDNELLRKISETFSDDMKKITKQVEAFLQKYQTAAEGNSFRKDYAALVYSLEKRIKSEEEILFPAYQNL